MITVTDYYLGRDNDPRFALQLSVDMRRAAVRTVELANKALILAKAGGVGLEASPHTGTIVSSGWRPPAINGATPGAALRSKHLSCQAIDLYDPDGDLDEWLLANSDTVLKDLGLWLEHPAATKGWAHLQTVPPASGRRTFYP